jgi:hypothetical protein
MDDLKFLITGTGRCGSVFFARWLTHLGIPCGHESIFDWNGLDIAIQRIQNKIPKALSIISQENCNAMEWIDPDIIEAESSYMSAPFLDHSILDKTKIIHCVRHPVKVVNSFCNYHNYFQNPELHEDKWESFIYRHISELNQNLTPYDRTCLYYIRWNELIEYNLNNRDCHFHRIEDDMSHVFNFINVLPTTNVFDDKKINSLQKPSAKFDISLISNPIIRKMFVQIGEKYGYDMRSKNWLI